MPANAGSRNCPALARGFSPPKHWPTSTDTSGANPRNRLLVHPYPVSHRLTETAGMVERDASTCGQCSRREAFHGMEERWTDWDTGMSDSERLVPTCLVH